KGDTGEVKDAEFKMLPGKELRVFPEDKDVPKDAINGKIDETFVPRAKVKLPEEGKFEEWKKGLVKELKERSLRGLMERVPVMGLNEVISGGLKSIDGVEIAHMNVYDKSLSCFSQVSFAGNAKVNPQSETLVLLNSGDQIDAEPPKWAEPFVGNWK